MLPDFGSLKRRFQEENYKSMLRSARDGGLLGSVEASVILHEGHETVVHARDETVFSTPLEESSSTVDIEIARLEKEGLAYVDELQEKLIREMNRQMSERIIERIGSVCEQTGNKYDAGNRPFGPELLIEMLERYPLDFDEKGEPIMPTLFVGQKIMDSVKRMSREDDETHKERFDKLIKRKRQEWRAREATRRLVE
jgi:hypothetical protein